MSGLIPPRSRSVTTAGVLALATGCLWLAEAGGVLWVWQDGSQGISPGHLRKILLAMSVVGCMSVGTVIGSFGIWWRRNWGRILLIALSGPWMLYGWFFVKPFLALPASVRPDVVIAQNAFPFAAAIAWLAILGRKKVRTEFLPPAIVQIYVNLLNEGMPCSRPSQAYAWGNGLFELLPTKDYDPKVERWEFLPGSFVHAKKVDRDGEPYLVAVPFQS